MFALASCVDPFHGGDPAHEPFCPVNIHRGEEPARSEGEQVPRVTEEPSNIIYWPSSGRKAVTESSPTSTVSTSAGSPASTTTTAAVDGAEADTCVSARSQRQASPKPQRHTSPQYYGWGESPVVQVMVQSNSWHPGCRQISPSPGRPSTSRSRFHPTISAARACEPSSPSIPRLRSWAFQAPKCLPPSPDTAQLVGASSSDSLVREVHTVSQTGTQTSAPVRLVLPSGASLSSARGHDRLPRMHMATQQGQFATPVRHRSFQR